MTKEMHMTGMVRSLSLVASGLTLFAALGAPVALAQRAGGGIQLVNVVEREIEIEEKGTTVKKLVAPGKVVPGDEVVYTTTYTNTGTRPAEKVVITNPVPTHTRYREGSALGAGTRIAFSVDGGKTYAPREKLSVTSRDASGKDIVRPATADDYTNIRWELTDAVAPGKSGFVRFRVVVK